MTASEKLRELEVLYQAAASFYIDVETSELHDQMAVFIDALPEIVTLVAAAERLASYNEIHTWKRDGETTALPELAEPLAALDAALHAN